LTYTKNGRQDVQRRFSHLRQSIKLMAQSCRIAMTQTPVVAADSQAVDQIAGLLRDMTSGKTHTLGQLFGLAQRELRQVAHRERLGMSAGETLSTTALINEAFLKFGQRGLPALNDRQHFFAVAARAMRQILVDYARVRLAQKRGSGVAAEPLDEHAQADRNDAEQMLELDRALAELETAHARLSQVVHLRFYAGMNNFEIANLLSIDESTVRRDWLKARGWLYRRLQAAPHA
jgi:RNA polymerase sigma factor (TIGR02999 family)